MVGFTFRNSQQEMTAWMLANKSSGGGSSRIAVTSTLRDRTPVPQEEPLEEAEVIWGDASNFQWGSRSKNVEDGPQVQTTWNIDLGGDGTTPDPEEPEQLPAIVYDWQELERSEQVVRINGPDGAYVDDARAVVSTFRLPDSPDGRAVYVRMAFLKFND